MKKLILASALVLSVTAAFGEVPSPTGCEQGPNGEVNVLVGTDKIAVGPSLLEQPLGSGTRVLALVPTDAAEAWQIFPVEQAAWNSPESERARSRLLPSKPSPLGHGLP